MANTDWDKGSLQAPTQQSSTDWERGSLAAPAEPGFIPTIKRTGGQMLTTAATSLEDVTGPNAVTKAVQETGQGIIDRNPAGITKLGDVVDSPWLAVKEAAGQFAPQIGAAAVGGLAGAKAGAAIGSLAGPAGAGVGGAIGGVAGSLLPIFTQEYGGIRQEQKESGHDDKARALAAAIPATALERVGMGKALNVLKGVPGGAAGTILKEVGKGVLKEGATEGAQNVIEQVGAFKDPTSSENLQDTALSAVMGGIGGGVMGGAVGVANGARRQGADPLSGAVSEQQGTPLEATIHSIAGSEAFASGQPMQPPADLKSVAAKAQWVKGWQQAQADAAAPPQSPEAATAQPDPGMDGARQASTEQLAALQEQEQGDPGVPQTTPPDGAAILAQQQADAAARRQAAQEASRAVASPDDEIYQSTGAEAPPSVRMGLDPAAGPLSAGAALAVDTGVHGQMQQAAALTQAAEQAAKDSKKPAAGTQKQEQQAQARQGVDPETGEIQQGAMAGWSDAQLSEAFRGAQSRDVRMQMARELSRRRAEREQQALQAELDAEQTGTVPGAERADAASASLIEDAGPVPADLSIPTTKGSTDGHQADQAQQARSKSPQEGATPAVARAAPDAQGIAGPQDASAAGVANGAPTTNPGTQGTAAPGASAQAQGYDFTIIKDLYGKAHRILNHDLQDVNRKKLRTLTAGGKPSAVRVHRDNLDPTGEKFSAQSQENAANPLFNTITNKDGAPFADKLAAQRAVAQMGLKETHEVTQVQGGFVGVKKQSPQTRMAAETVATTPTTPAQVAAPAGPTAKKTRGVLAKKAEAEAKARAEYFTPGNIVKSYGGHDRVVSYTPPDADGRWSVTVRAVRVQDGKVVDAPNELERTHATPPDARELKAGPVMRGSAIDNLSGPKSKVDPGEQDAATPRNLWMADERSSGTAGAAQDGPSQQDAGAAPVGGAGQRAGGDSDKPAPAVRAPVPDAGGASEQAAGVAPAQQSTTAAQPITRAEVDDVQQQASVPRPTTARIEDFGETLHGARKMLYAEAYADGMAKAKKLDTKAHPLSKTWPEPDYQKLLEGGAPVEAVSMARALREAVPTKPQSSWKLKGWAAKVEALRGFAEDVLSGRLDIKTVEGSMERSGLRGVPNKAALYEAMGHERSMKGIDVSVGRYSMYDRVEYNPPRTIWTVSREAKGSSFGNWPRELAKGDTREAAIAAFKKRSAELLAEEQAPTKGATFEIYGKRAGGAREFFIGKKIGRNVAELKTGFADLKAARQYKADHQSELEDLLAKYKAVPPVRNTQNAPRIGEDYRKGADVTPERFQEAFGFRGVQFGNYVEGGRRQQDLNRAYDALMDLAGVLGLPPRALSLGGRLGLAFGARGTGGTDAAAAHYEPDTVVINLTKREGAGSMAHEWWHALDNYFSRQRGDGGSYMTSDSRSGDGVREEMRAAFRAVMSAINLTGMQERSRKLDDRRTKEYWTTKPEMSARAFESYVIAKLQDQNAGNDYLANVVGDAVFALEGAYPYPTAGELPQIRAAFDGFFQAVETKEDGAGNLVLFSRATDSVPQSVAEWLPDTVIADEVEKRIGDFAQQPPIRIRDTAFGQLPGVARNDNVAGAVHDGAIYLFRDQLGDRAAVQRTLFHELFHYGLRKFLTKEQFTGQMMDLYRRDKAIRDEADRWAATVDGLRAEEFGGREYALARGVDEALAILAEPNGGPHLNQTARAMFVRRVTLWLADVAQFLKMDKAAAYLRSLHNSEARAYIQSVFKRLESDAGRVDANWSESGGPAFSRASTADMPADESAAGAGFNVDGFLSTMARSAASIRAAGTTDRAIMDMVREGRAAPDILRLVAGTSKSRFNRQVARTLLKTGAAPSVELVQADLGSSDGFKFLAKYSRKNDKLTMTPGAEPQAEHIFMHEMVHAATLRALDRKGLASLQMRRLYEHVKRQGDATGHYGMKNVGEFVAEAFTNPEFQRELRGISAPPGGTLKSAWDGFVRILRSILGLPQDAHDALSRALELGVAVMREDMALRQRGAQQRQAGDAFVQSPQTRATYEGRIDALFNGGKAHVGTAVLDRSDVMGLLGHPNVPLMLNERHLLDGLTNHPEMTAAAWKKVPGWLENPAAVFTDPNHPGRLTVIAPERIAGYPVLMAVEPNPTPTERGKTAPFQLLVTVFAKTAGDLPALGYLGASGRLLYADTKKAPEVWQRAGVNPQAGRHPGPRARDIPRTGGPTSGAKKILTEKHLGGYRRANTPVAFMGQPTPPADSNADSAMPAKPLTLDRVNQLVQEALSGIRGAPPVETVGSPADIGLVVPPATVPYGITLRSGDVYVFQSAMGSDLDVFRTVFHELFHRGVRVLVPKDQYVQVMLDLAKGDSRIQQYAIRWKDSDMAIAQKENLRKMGYTGAELTAQFEALAIEEALADVAEEIKAEGKLGSRPKNHIIRFLANWLAKVADLAGMKKLAAGIRAMTYNEAERFVMGAIDRSGEPAPRAGVNNMSAKDGARTQGVVDSKVVDDDVAHFGMADAGALKSGAIDHLHRALSHPGKVSLWDKTVGTMRNLAERNPAFKPVYQAAQRFIDDVSMLGNDAADRAPRLLPRVETLADLKKKPITAADNKAVGKPLFEGTLLWARDLDGTPVTTEALNAKYRNATADEKAQILLRTGKIQAQMLKVWRGLPVGQFNAIINNKFDSTILKPGVVWTAKELGDLFGLNDQQVSLYQEARRAIDRSIDMTARADMLRMMGDEYASMREVVLEQASMQDAMALLTETLQSEARENPDQADRLMGMNNSVVKSYERAAALQEAGYAPLSRFGRYTVDVVSPDGTREYFGMFESMSDANLMAERMRGEFKGAAVTQGTMSDDAYKLFAGITPESLEQFGEMLGLKTDGDTAQDKAFQAYLQLSKNNHSALKRLIHRKGITGYSEDVGRVLASFVYSNARLAAGGLNAGTLETAIENIPKEQGELRDVAMGLRSYIQDPQEEGQAVRGMLFAQYLGGSVASAMVNMTQPFQITMPWLSQYGGMRKAAGQMARALKDMGTKGFKYEPDLEKALQDAVDDGTVSPQEIHQLMAQARGTGSLRAGDGTRMGDARAAMANNWERTKVAWGQPFALAEQFNRRSTFIAAYRTAKEQGMPAPAEFARRAVQETQFVYSKANKMRWGRGAIGGTMMTFKTYSVSYLELMHRMWTQGGPEGKRAVGWAVAMLMLMGGAGGLPFMEDAEDLIDGAGQLMGYNISTKQWRKQLLRDTIGKELGDFVEQGVSGLPGAPIDVSGRLGMGNLLPGTGLLLTKQNRERDLLEIAGPAGDLIARGFTGARKMLTGDLAGAALEVSPTAVRNAVKGLDMATSGIYKDTKGYKVIDTTLDEAIAKAIGFQPRSVAEVQESNSFMQRSKSFYIQTSSDIKAQWAQALFNKDDAALERVRERLADWNRDNPDQPIVVKMPDVWKRVREMGKDRTQRIADTAPKALRGQMREMARENG